MNVHNSIIRVAKEQMQPKCPLTDEWVNKIFHIHKMQYYSTIMCECMLSTSKSKTKERQQAFWRWGWVGGDTQEELQFGEQI